MAEEKDPLFDFIREEMEQVQVEPSDQVWEALDAHLDQKKRRAGWYYFSAGVAAVMVAGLFFIQPITDLFTPEAESTKPTLTENIDKPSSTNKAEVVVPNSPSTETKTPESIKNVVEVEGPDQVASSPKTSKELKVNNLPAQKAIENQATQEATSSVISNKGEDVGEDSKVKVVEVEQSTKALPRIASLSISSFPVNDKAPGLSFSTPGKIPQDPGEPSARHFTRGKTFELKAAMLSGSQSPFIPEDVPADQLFVEDNRVKQELVNSKTDASFNWSISARGGIQLFKDFYFVGGVQYNQWSGKGYTYYTQVYENQTTFSVEHWSPKTVERIVEETENASLTTNQFNERFGSLTLTDSTMEGVQLIGTGSNFPAPQEPKTRVITETIYTVETTEITVIDHAVYDDTVVTNYRYQTLAIPLQMRWMWQAKGGKLRRLGGFLSAGVSLQAWNQHRTESHNISTAYQNEIVQRQDGYFQRTDALFSAGLSYQLDPRIALYLTPELRLPMGSQPVVSTGNTWSAGAGILFHF